jgi:hypothetical protein
MGQTDGRNQHVLAGTTGLAERHEPLGSVPEEVLGNSAAVGDPGPRNSCGWESHWIDLGGEG